MNSKEMLNRVDEIFEVKSFADCMEEYRVNQKELNKKVYIKKRCIILNIGYEYVIELNRCNTEAKLLHWIHHLLGKSWMTLEILENFIEKVAGYHNLDIHSLD